MSLLTAGHHQFSGWFESEEPLNQLTNLLVHAPQWAGEGRQQQRRTDATPAEVTRMSSRFQCDAAVTTQTAVSSPNPWTSWASL